MQANEPDNTMRQCLIYDAVKVDGPKGKILEFNSELKSLDDKELKHLDTLCDALADKSKYFNTKLNDYHNLLLTKLLSWPVDKLFPCLDLYRIFLLHPDCTMHCKKFEDGANHLYSLCSPLMDKTATDPAKMLALRCICNLSREPTAVYVLREKSQKTIEAVSPHLKNSKNTVREAAITVLLNFSIFILQKEDHNSRVQILSALSAI